MRALADLLHADDALPLLREWASAAPHPVEILAPDDGARTLLALQVTTRSPLGAVAYHTGGILVDRGWLRILGAGAPRLPRALDLWNAAHPVPDGWLVADDAVGGFFAWRQPGPTVHYLAPDTLGWEDLGLG